MVRREVEWRTDEHGFLLGVPHHDGVLVGLGFVEGKRLTLSIRSVDGGISHIRLLGLRGMNLMQLCAGTIVMDLRAWRLSAVPETIWQTHDGA